MLRIVNKKNGEYYLIPRPLDKNDFHLSYHKSGQFHWAIDQEQYFPLRNEKDFREAFRGYLIIKARHKWIVGYCVACGQRVEKDSLKTMLNLLSRYIPIDFNSDVAINDVFKRKHVTQWNRSIHDHQDIQISPLATGLMLVELNQNHGILHTLNCILTSDKKLVAHRVVPRKLFGFIPMKRRGFEEVSLDDVKQTYAVFM